MKKTLCIKDIAQPTTVQKQKQSAFILQIAKIDLISCVYKRMYQHNVPKRKQIKCNFDNLLNCKTQSILIYKNIYIERSKNTCFNLRKYMYSKNSRNICIEMATKVENLTLKEIASQPAAEA